MSGTVLQLWTGPRCQTGAIALGPIAQIESGRITEATSGASGPVLSLSRAVADTLALRAGTWLWVSHPRRGVSEWPILTVTMGDGRSRDTVSVQGGTIRQAIALRGTIRQVNTVGAITTSFTPPAVTPAELLSTYFFTNLAADNLEWLAPGAMEWTSAITIPAIAQWTRGQLLDAIENATGYRFVFERLGDSGYQLSLRNPATLGTTDVPLAPGVTVDTIEQTEDLVSGATVVEPRSRDGLPLGETWWTVGSIIGTGPYWVRLVDPANGPAVIREDGQVTNWWLRPNDGTAIAITDSRASDSAVQVAGTDGLIVGGLAALWRTADGALPFEIPSPSGVALRGRVVQTTAVTVPSMGANRLTDPALRNALASWQRVNASAGGLDVWQRDDPRTLTLQVNGAVAGGGTAVTVDNGPPTGTVRAGDPLFVSGADVTGNGTVTTSATGTATIPLVAPLPATLTDGTVLRWNRSGTVLGAATVSGTNPAGAMSLALRALPPTPQLANADVLVKSVAPGVGLTGPNYTNTSQFTIPSGAPFTGSARYRVPRVLIFIINGVPTNVPTVTFETVTWAGTVTAPAAPGALVSLSDGVPSPPPTVTIESEGIFVSIPTPPVQWTITGTPPAWDSTGRATVNISGTLGQPLQLGEVLTWQRSGTYVEQVRVTAPVGSGASTIPLELVSATRLLTGDTFSLAAQTLYADRQVTLDATGAGTIPLRVPTANGVADNALVTIERPRDLAATQFGGPNVLRLRGSSTTWPSIYLGGTDFGVYSPIMRVQSPTMPGASYAVKWSILVSQWAAEPNQLANGYFGLWDVDTQQLVSFGPIANNTTVPYTPLFTFTNHLDVVAAIGLNFTTPRRLRLSLHGAHGHTGNYGGALLLRGVALSVFPTGATGAALVDGGFANQGWHSAQDLLDATRETARYRVTLSTVAPFADDPAQLLVVGGRVRLRSEALGLDRRFRVSRIVWSLNNDDAIELELATATPRLSEST